MSDQTTGNYIFRIYDDGASDIHLECWGHSSKLDSNRIRTIRDTIRKGSSKVATSVPSPFARMYLFDTAFKMVSEQLDGDTVYHHLVSDCLDIFQMLFNAGNGDANIKFQQWNRNERINKLKNNPDGHPHKLLADSLDLFFTNKFSDVQDVTLIYYKDILLGGTSPLTVFFTSPNWHREMKENGFEIESTTSDKYFDSDYAPLHLRDNMFVEFIWKFYLSYRSILNEKCDGFSSYIRNTIATYNKYLERKMNNEWADYINTPQKLEHDYQRINVIPNSSAYLQVNDIFAYAVKSDGIPSKIESESDFKMAPTVDYYKNEVDENSVPTNPRTPLVLVKGMNVPGTFTYDNTPWNPSTDIRYGMYRDTNGNPILLAHRYLPGISQIQYPFVTTEDFLEDNLVKMPFKINNKKFLSGYSGDFNYLLPIKKEFFNFFTKEDLQNNLEIIPLDNKITVTLKIPVRNTRGNAKIVLSKDYEFANTPVAQCKAGLATYPFYRIKDAEENLQKLNDYTVLFADKNDKLKVDVLEFWQTENIVVKKSINVAKPEPRTKKGISAASYYYKVNAPFDLIEIKLSDDSGKSYSGLVIPQFNEVYNHMATKKFTFAIDFGTSNSHISYTDLPTDKKPKTFDISEDEMQMILLNKPGETKVIAEKYRMGYDAFPEIDALVNREFIPAIMGKEYGSYATFPIRTATCEKSSFQAETAELFNNINVGFFIDSDETKPENCIYQTNLKWLFENRDNSYDTYRIGAFLKVMLQLIRNKVIMSGGKIEDTKVVWLVPLSMKSGSVENFTKEWHKAFSEVFKGTCKNLLEPITESVAPYFYLINYKDANIRDFADALNIDIGGGTTDVMFFMRKTKNYFSTSFRFAGSDIWGDGFNKNEKDNGFLRNLSEVRSRSKQCNTKEDVILQNFMRDNTLTAEDVTSLLFRYDDHFKFSESINRNKPALKLIFFLHYSSIVYHLVQLIENKDLSIPRYFTFTGKGSQYINLMCSNDSLTKFTKLLFNAYSSYSVPSDFRVVLTSNPKEATANGAVLFINSPDKDKISLIKDNIIIINHWGCENKYEVNFTRNSTKIGEVAKNAEFHKSVLMNLQTFIEKTLRNNDIVAFLGEYGIYRLEEYEKFLTSGDAASSGELYDSYYSLLENLKVYEDAGISETFFFLALKDALYSLSKKIVEQR